MNDPAKQRGGALKDATCALALANLCFLFSWLAILSDDPDLDYFTEESLTRAGLLALACNVFFWASLFWLGARLLRRTQNRAVLVLGCLACLVVLTAPAEFLRINILRVRARQVIDLIQHPGVWLLGALTLGAIAAWPRLVLRWMGRAIFPFFVFALFCLGKLLLLLVTADWSPKTAVALAPLTAQPPPARLVWIIFDEMDQRLSFPERPPGLRLPEFDRLRAESLAATHAYSPSDATLSSIPSLLTGRICRKANPVSASELALTLADTNTPMRWSELPNVFSKARSLGCNTAVVGSYHPYARVLAKDLNFCEWRRMPGDDPVRDTSFLQALGRQLSYTAPVFHARRVCVAAYRDLLGHSLEVAPDPKYGLLFLHLPVPHEPGIYDPLAGRLTLFAGAGAQGYRANLQLADRTLGEIRRGMEATGIWNKTWVLISSDHCWRDAPKREGKRDYRVPFLIKPPGGTPAMTYEAPMNTVLSQNLVLAILGGEISSIAQMPAWLQAQPPSPLPNYQLPQAAPAK